MHSPFTAVRGAAPAMGQKDPNRHTGESNIWMKAETRRETPTTVAPNAKREGERHTDGYNRRTVAQWDAGTIRMIDPTADRGGPPTPGNTNGGIHNVQNCEGSDTATPKNE